MLNEASDFCGDIAGLFCDDFQSGASPRWQTLTGSHPGNCAWTVDHGTYNTSNSGTQQLCIRCVLDPSWENYIFEVRVRSNAGVCKEVTFRSLDGLNTYDVNMVGDPINEIHLNKVVNGVSYRKATVPFFSEVGVWYGLRIACVDATFTIFVDNRHILQYTDPVNPFLTGGIGLVSWTGDEGICNVSFDDVAVIVQSAELDFQLDQDEWQFINSESNVWPYGWQFWKDPWDEKCWCGSFPTYSIRLCFPTWEIFRNAFGPEQTENDNGDRLEHAEAFWNSQKKCFSEYPGSCYGFSATTLLFLDDYHFTVSEEFPGRTYLYEVQPTDADDRPRTLIGTYILYELGREQQTHFHSHSSDGPIETFEACLQIFNGSPDNYAFLGLHLDDGYHTMNPYRCDVDPENQNLLYIYVYDNMDPWPGEEKKVVIDKSTTPATWSYGSTTNDQGDNIFLMDPISNYTDYAILPVSTGGGGGSWKNRNPVSPSDTTEKIQIFLAPVNDAVLESEFGVIGHSMDSVFNTTDSGWPFITFSSQPVSPIGYELPNAKWNM